MIDRRITVDLSFMELHNSLYIATARAMVPRSPNLPEYERTGTLRTHYLGVKGEIAVAKAFGVTADLTVGRGDDGYDMIIDGHKVQVKAYSYFPDPWMHVKPSEIREGHKPDVFFVVLVEEFSGHCELCGWTILEHVEKTPLRPFKPKWPKSRSIPEKDLRPFDPRRLKI